MSGSSLASGPSARVNSVTMLSFDGKSVTLLGTVHEVSNTNKTIVLMACDYKTISVTFPNADLSDVSKGQILDVIGTMKEGKLVGEAFFPVNGPMDMELYNQAISYSGVFPSLF